MPRHFGTKAAFAPAPFRIDQRTQIFKAVSGDLTAGREFPQSVLDLAGQQSCRFDQLRQE